MDVSGLTVAAIADTPKVMSEGNWRLGVLIDDSASDEQAEKLGAVFGGQLGGPMEALGPLIGEQLGVERVPMEVSHDNGTHRIKVGDGASRGPGDRAVRQGGRRAGAGSPASSIRPAKTSTVANATKSQVSAFGIDFAFEGTLRLRQPLLLGGIAWRRAARRAARRRRGSSAPSSPCSPCCSPSPSWPGRSPTTAWAAWSRRRGEPGGLGFYVTVWVVMMAAMMFPSVAPTVLMYDRLRAGHRARGKGRAGRRDGAVRRGLPPGVDGGRSRRLRPVRARPGDRPRLPGLGRGRAAT